ncbi:MAG: glycosyltransferase [Clostridia bacterium]|nr:glycosyltransferase [Clostridia bacterium]
MILTCGGTGGHITPALAIADVIRQNIPRAEISFVGAKGAWRRSWSRRQAIPSPPLPSRAFRAAACFPILLPCAC